MATIRSYDNDATIHDQDKLIGSDGSTGPDNGKTKNYTVSALKEFILESVSPGSTVVSEGDLQSVLITLSPDQVLAFNGGNTIEVLPQPEAGKAYDFIGYHFYIQFNTTAYNFSGSTISVGLGYSSTNDTLTNTKYPFYPGTFNVTETQSLMRNYFNTGTYLLNEAMVLKSATNTVVTEGDSAVKIKVFYKIVDIVPQ